MELIIQPDRPQIKTYRDLIVYQLAFELAIQVFEITKQFPADERYGLTDQFRRAARSIPANIAEGWAKRTYASVFKRHLYDAMGSCEEAKVWLELAWRYGFLGVEKYETFKKQYAEVGAMLAGLAEKWRRL